MAVMAESFVPLEDWYADVQSHTHRGHEIVYRRDGCGEALLVIHGFPSASWDFHKIWRDLARRFDVIAPDMIGFGCSAKPKRYPYSLFDQADLMEGLLEALGIARLHLLAHDYGDSVVQEMLARATERADYPEIRSAVLMNGGLFYDCIRFAPMQRLMRSPLGRVMQYLMTRRRFERAFAAIFGPETRPSSSELEAFWRLIACNRGRRVIHALSQYLSERQRYQERWSRALAETSVPLALIYGPEDPISGVPIATRFREVAAGSEVMRLARIGHFPQIEAPDAVISGLAAFHSRLVGTGG